MWREAVIPEDHCRIGSTARGDCSIPTQSPRKGPVFETSCAWPTHPWGQENPLHRVGGLGEVTNLAPHLLTTLDCSTRSCGLEDAYHTIPGLGEERRGEKRAFRKRVSMTSCCLLLLQSWPGREASGISPRILPAQSVLETQQRRGEGGGGERGEAHTLLMVQAKWTKPKRG